jgi:hypothetical protein
MPFKTVLLIMASLLLAGGGYYAAQVHVDEGVMKEDMETMNRNTMNKVIPPIDMKMPSSVETATFAMG